MKTLFLMRHAKSSWDSPNLSDYERPLSKRGENSAPKVGAELANRGYEPEYILSSSAKRAAQTIRLAAESGGFDAEIVFERSLYGAGHNTLFYMIGEFSDIYQSAMMVGHNPGFEQLLELLTNVDERMPTAALAVIEFDVERWDMVEAGGGRLMDFILPRDLNQE